MRKILILLFVIFLNACIINNIDLNDYINEVAIEYQEGDSQFQVTQNLTLPTEVSNSEIKVTWSSDNVEVVSTEGIITRPDVNTLVTLTVTLSYLNETQSKKLDVLVIRDEDVQFFEITINVDGVEEVLIYYEPVKLDNIVKPAKEGYIFKEWIDSEGNSLSLELVLDKNIILIAVFEEIIDSGFFVTIIIGDQEQIEYFDGPIVLIELDIPEREGYEFSHWINGQGDVLDLNFQINDDISITAIFKAITYSGYYETLQGLSDSELYNKLQSLIQNYTYTSYGYARDILQDSDEDPDRAENVILVYNRESVRSEWDGGRTWNREHVWPQSKLPNEISKDDVHNLRPCNPSVNSSRGNSRFTYSNGSSEYGNHNTGGWYPGDEDRGDIARIVMYMTIMWEINIDLVGNIQLFLQWHEEDPVDDFEANRNNVIFQYTNNKNPFIDHPELAYRIFGEPSDNIYLIKILESTNNLLTLNKVMLVERKK